MSIVKYDEEKRTYTFEFDQEDLEDLIKEHVINVLSFSLKDVIDPEKINVLLWREDVSAEATYEE